MPEMTSKWLTNEGDVSGNVRLSDSPRRSPRVVPATTERSKSVRAEEEGEQPLSERSDHSQRSVDLWGPMSDDVAAYDLPLDENAARHQSFQFDLTSSPPWSLSEHEPKPAAFRSRGGSSPSRELTNTQQLAEERLISREAPSPSFNGSVDEMLTSDPIKVSRFSKTSEPTPRSSASHRPHTQEELHAHSNMTGRAFGAHLLAHEITLQALMRDEDIIDRKVLSTAVENAQDFRLSLLPPSLRIVDARDRRKRTVSNPERKTRKIHIVPPPVNTTDLRHPLPDDHQPTPYPFPEDQTHHKDLTGSPAVPKESPRHLHRTLTLTIRGCRQMNDARFTVVIIPPPNRFSIARPTRPGQHISHPPPSFFDDEDFFEQLRLSFRLLSGRFRHFSARSLHHIAISRHHAMSDRVSADVQMVSPVSTDTGGLPFEESLIKNFRNPKRRRAKYRFVRWAYALADQTPASGFRHARSDSRQVILKTEDEKADSEKQDVNPISRTRLEFVVDWSACRIGLALGLVITFSVLAALLWVLLGRNTPTAWHAQGGFRDAGDRVESGMLIGIAVLLLGLSIFGGWIGLSWLAM